MSKGIDKSIDALITDFTANLWNDNTRSFYGRVFRNQRFSESKISPEIWITPNNYIEVLKDLKYDAQCFFDVQPDIDINTDIHTAKVWGCFMVNLQSLYPTLTRTEATEQVQSDVKSILLMSPFTITGLKTGYTGFESYDWGELPQQRADLSPHYLFRFDLQLIYINSSCT